MFSRSCYNFLFLSYISSMTRNLSFSLSYFPSFCCFNLIFGGVGGEGEWEVLIFCLKDDCGVMESVTWGARVWVDYGADEWWSYCTFSDLSCDPQLLSCWCEGKQTLIYLNLHPEVWISKWILFLQVSFMLFIGCFSCSLFFISRSTLDLPCDSNLKVKSKKEKPKSSA